MLLKMSWRNLWRHRRRTLLTISAIGLGLGVLIAMVSFMMGMYEMFVEQVARSSMGHIQLHNPQYLEKRSVPLVMKGAGELTSVVESVPGVKAVSPRLLFTGSIRSTQTSSVYIVKVTAIDPKREAALSGLADKVTEGGFVVPPAESLDPDAPARVRGRKGILIGAKLARLLKVGLGSKVRVDTAGFQGSTSAGAFYVTGILRAGSDSLDKQAAWVSLADMQQVTGAGDAAHEISVVVDDMDQIPSVVDRIKEAIAAANTDGSLGPVQVQPWWEISPEIKQMLDLSQGWTRMMYLLMLAILSAGILTTMFMVVYERSRELGVQLALGTRPSALFTGIMLEALFIAALASGAGLAIGGLAVLWFSRVGIDLSSLVGGWEFAGLFIENVYKGSTAPAVFVEPTVVVFAGTVLLALWPGFRVARMKALDGMRSGGITG